MSINGKINALHGEYRAAIDLATTEVWEVPGEAGHRWSLLELHVQSPDGTTIAIDSVDAEDAATALTGDIELDAGEGFSWPSRRGIGCADENCKLRITSTGGALVGFVVYGKER